MLLYYMDSVHKNKYINKLKKLSILSKELDNIDEYIKKNQNKNNYYLNEYIKLLELSNVYISNILKQQQF